MAAEPTEEMVIALRETLGHLQDPTFVVPDCLRHLPNGTFVSSDEARLFVLTAIERLEPQASTPSHVQSVRLYRVLKLRYLDQLTQRQVAAELSLAVRHLARLQAQAIYLLAQTLWEQAQKGQEEGQTGTRLRQMEREIQVLYQASPEARTDLGAALKDVAALTHNLVERHGAKLWIDCVCQDVQVALPSSALRQALVAAVSYMARNMCGGEIRLKYRHTAAMVYLSLVGDPAAGEGPPDHWLAQELLAAAGGEVRFMVQGPRMEMLLVMPTERQATVLVIDDNQDLVHFYRRALAGLNYQIVALNSGAGVIEAVAEYEPDVIVLDLMLPDVDGWDLLVRLHENPDSRHIPIVVCSVVNESELATSLGASVCISKPVRRLAFRQALAEAFSQAEGKG